MGKSGTAFGDVPMSQKVADLRTALDTGALTLTQKPEYAERTGTLEYPDFTPWVNAGAAWLDEHTPGWDLKIDLSSLNLDDQSACVLGQSWTHYADSLRKADEFMELYTDEDNFKQMVRAATAELNTSEENFAKDPDTVRMEWASAHGFALDESVYRWAHVEARRRISKEYKLQLDENEDLHDDLWAKFAALTWVVDAELWEQLTATWTLLIQARQNVAIKS